MTVLLILLGLILLAVGILGIVYPALPGLPLMFVGALAIAWAGQFGYMAWWSLGSVAVLAVVGSALDYVAGTLGAKFSGASRQAVIGSIIGTVIGAVLSLTGMWLAIFLGPLVGAAVGELVAKRDVWQAGQVGIATFIGLIVGVAAKIGCAFVILLIVLLAHVAPWLQSLWA